MKRNIILILISALLTTYGCDDLRFGDAFLEKAPGVDITKDTIFGNIKYAEDFLWGAYKSLPYGLNVCFPLPNNPASLKFCKMNTDVLESLSDFSHSYLGWGGATPYYNGSYNANTEDVQGTKYNYIYSQAWDGIRMGYIIIENIDKVPNATPEYKKWMKGEARMIIAMHYVDMFRNFGGVPWLDHAYTPNENTTNFPRIPAQEMCDSIVAIIDQAITELPWTLDDPETWDGRFTKAGAMGLKARLLLFNASPLFNDDQPYLEGEAAEKKLVWHGAKKRDLWKQAADAAHELIEIAESTGDYKLYHVEGNSYRQDFQGAYIKRGNGEVLISIRYLYKTSDTVQGYRFYASSGPAEASNSWSVSGWGCGNVTDEYVRMFPDANGIPIDDPTSSYMEEFPYENRDPRLYETVMVNGDAFRGRTVELYLGGRERPSAGNLAAMSGHGVRKFILDGDDATTLKAVAHWPHLRLPEIYLTYAEAINEYNGGPTPEAYRCVNIVRNRVGLKDLPDNLTQEQFREAVILERALEFGWEEVRWYDLVRWKREADFTKTLRGVNIEKTNDLFGFSYTQFDLPTRYWKNNWSPKWYLSAFPTREMNKDYGLIQNPGW